MNCRLLEKEAMLYQQLSDDRVECELCAKRCIIPLKSVGSCRVRRNRDGKLYTLIYGKSAIVERHLVEENFLTHFYPSSLVLSLATVGCNFDCLFCGSWNLSRREDPIGRNLPPKIAVKLAKQYKCNGIGFTHTEPAVYFEYAYDTARLAKSLGLFNIFLTNGYLTSKAIRKIGPYLDAATVCIKGGVSPSFYRRFVGVADVDPIFEALKELKRRRVHIEIANLVVPKYGDSIEDIKELALWILQNLGDNTPLHLVRFHPNYKMIDLPSTPVHTLEEAYQAAVESGLKYVYIRDVPGHKFESTYCPSCKKLVVRRYGPSVIEWRLSGRNRCSYCGERIHIVGGLSTKWVWKLFSTS